jgi:hypothetical protein
MFSIHPKYFTPTLGEDTKRSLLGINALSSYKCLSLKFSNLQKEACGYAKRKVLKNIQVFEISKTMGTQMPAMKKREKERNKKDSTCSLAEVFFKFQTREI